jgi:hypothetical protein
MKNAQDEGLKPQPTDITASSVVINKSEENSPRQKVMQIVYSLRQEAILKKLLVLLCKQLLSQSAI